MVSRLGPFGFSAGITVECTPTARVLRTYRQIASILNEKDGDSISAESVEQICTAAEVKITRALFAELQGASGTELDSGYHQTPRACSAASF